MNNILVAMSGGVDSSVTALRLLSEGYQCHGAMMRLFSPTDLPATAAACAKTGAEDAARAVAARLGISFSVVECEEDFRHCVMEYFVRSYLAGETPNPCVECNRTMKFGALLQYADTLSMDGIATGHYARITRAPGGRYLLSVAKDTSKDQSYVLWQLSQKVLSRTLLPLGDLTKEEVRTLAADADFVNAKTGDSQDICFVPDGDYVAFLEHVMRKKYPAGDFVDADGTLLGQHQGMIRYTIGQRKGLGIAFGAPTYVIGKDAATNRVLLGSNDALFSRTLTARDANWIAEASVTSPRRVLAKIRYNAKAAWAELDPIDATHFRLCFDEPQRAIAPGQSVVLYQDDVVLGGGIIE
jgi:tRNA-specific 2-thiouridylase